MVQSDTSFDETINRIDQIKKKSEFEFVLADTINRHGLRVLPLWDLTLAR